MVLVSSQKNRPEVRLSLHHHHFLPMLHNCFGPSESQDLYLTKKHHHDMVSQSLPFWATFESNLILFQTHKNLRIVLKGRKTQQRLFLLRCCSFLIKERNYIFLCATRVYLSTLRYCALQQVNVTVVLYQHREYFNSNVLWLQLHWWLFLQHLSFIQSLVDSSGITFYSNACRPMVTTSRKLLPFWENLSTILLCDTTWTNLCGAFAVFFWVEWLQWLRYLNI